MARATINDNDREDWVNNDESLYDWWRMDGASMRNFVRNNRGMIDSVIYTVRDGNGNRSGNNGTPGI